MSEESHSSGQLGLKLEDSLARRYFSKLGANVLGAPITLAIHALSPRLLGAQAYGDFSFLSSFFTTVVGFFDTGSSQALYVKLSQRPEEKGLLRLYWEVWLGLASLLALSVLFLASSEISSTIWPEQHFLVIVLAAVWGVLTWLSQTLSRLVDAFALTVIGEAVRVLQRLCTLVLFACCLFFMGKIALESFLLLQCAALVLLIVATYWVVRRGGKQAFPLHQFAEHERRTLSLELLEYVHPIVVYSVIALFSGIADRWMLQTFAGSTEQGYYGLAYQIGAVCFLFTSAMRPLLTREFAKARGGADKEEQAKLFRRYLPLLYTIAAYFGIFTVIHSGSIALIIGGAEFGAASAVVLVMGFYPIHQTYGQLSGALFFANSETRTYRNIGCSMMLLGMPLSYLLLASSGYDLGAYGLAVKMVVMQFVSVNIGLWINTKRLDLGYRQFLVHQFLVLAVLLSLGLLSRLVFSPFELSMLPSFLLNGVLYSLLVGGLCYRFPQVLGLEQSDVAHVVERLRQRFG